MPLKGTEHVVAGISKDFFVLLFESSLTLFVIYIKQQYAPD